MDENEIVLIYSTYPDAAAARRTAEALVAAKLAACVNILAPMQSVYAWQGKIETNSETAAIFKTSRALAQTLIETARPLHPYDIPCFLIQPVEGGWPPYLDWLRNSLAVKTPGATV